MSGPAKSAVKVLQNAGTWGSLPEAQAARVAGEGLDPVTKSTVVGNFIDQYGPDWMRQFAEWTKQKGGLQNVENLGAAVPLAGASMPGPFDLLKKGVNVATTPLVPEAPVNAMADSIDSPTLDRSPWEARLRGFGAGALQGARTLTSPLDIATLPIPGMKGLGGLGKAGGAVSRMVKPTMDIIEDIPVKQVAGSMDDVEAIIADSRRMMAKNLPRTPRAPAQTTLGEMSAEFAPATEAGEAMYNAGRQVPRAASPDGFYQDLMRKFGFGGTR